MNSVELNERLPAIYPQLWLIAAALSGDRGCAEDIVQESILVATKKIDQYRANSNFTAWLSKIVRLTAMNHAKKQRRRNTTPADPSDLNRDVSAAQADWATYEEDYIHWSRLADDQMHFDDEVVAALKSLSGEAQACLLLRTIAELTYNEISQLLDVSKNTAMSHVFRAKQHLRNRLSSQFDGLRPAK